MLDDARWSWPEQKQGNQIAKGNSNKFLFCAFFPAPVYFSFAFITFLSCVQINASLKKFTVNTWLAWNSMYQNARAYPLHCWTISHIITGARETPRVINEWMLIVERSGATRVLYVQWIEFDSAVMRLVALIHVEFEHIIRNDVSNHNRVSNAIWWVFNFCLLWNERTANKMPTYRAPNRKPSEQREPIR